VPADYSLVDLIVAVNMCVYVDEAISVCVCIDVISLNSCINVNYRYLS
jgi:hypothetical protein